MLRRIADDLYAVGTLVDVLNVTRQPDGTVQIVIEGIRRVGLEQVINLPSMLQCRATELTEKPDPAAASLLFSLA